MNKKAIAIGALLPSLVCAADSAVKRLANATTVIHEISRASDSGVPQDLLQKAQCVVVVPGLKKVAFIGGGKFGRGYASCITSKGWSGPAGVRIEGGSFGVQLGVSATDVIMLVMNQGGMTKLMSDKFTIGGEANAAAGPVGRQTAANMDVLLKAEILTYSRSKGLFAGLSLEGATLRPDTDANKELYGSDVQNLAILKGEVNRPASASAFLAQLQRFSGKGTPPSRKKKAAASSDSGDTAVASAGGSGPVAADNTKVNKSHAVTADQSKSNKSDVQIAAQIRKSIMADKGLSTYAHNVKVIVQHGAVTLKGPVNSDEEKSSVEAKATAVAGSGSVTNQITVVPPKQ